MPRCIPVPPNSVYQGGQIEEGIYPQKVIQDVHKPRSIEFLPNQCLYHGYKATRDRSDKKWLFFIYITLTQLLKHKNYADMYISRRQRTQCPLLTLDQLEALTYETCNPCVTKTTATGSFYEPPDNNAVPLDPTPQM